MDQKHSMQTLLFEQVRFPSLIFSHRPSSQRMEPAVKQLRCTYHRPTGRYIWKGAARQGNKRVLLSDPRVDCITMNHVARWGQWGPWSSWTKCSRECGTGEKIRQRRRVCVGGVMGENDNCPHQGNVQLEYSGCDNQCGK